MEKLNLTVTINTQRKDQKARCQVRIRQTVKRKVKYYATGINVMPEQFESGKIKNHPNKDAYNLALRNQMYKIEKDYLENELAPVTKISFNEYAAKKITQQKSKDSDGTWKHKVSYLSKLNRFKSNVLFKEITPSFLLDYENYCRAIGNKQTTVWGSLKFIKLIINCALNDGIITANPMRGYKMDAYVNPERNYLTDEEISRVEEFAATNENTTLVKVANWFLFGCYSGLRYSDVKNFSKKKIQDGRIILRTEKTFADVSIKIHSKLKAVLDRMCPNVFSNQKMNLYLKVIAAHCGINKRVTFHISRHTHAVYYLNHGGSMENLSKLLGHTSTRITSVYGKITNYRLDSEVDKVWG